MLEKQNKINFDNNLLKLHNKSIFIGVDEVGRGCLAGPVVACALFFKNNCFTDKNNFWLKDINDSKVINKSKRDELGAYIKKNSYFTIACINSNIIDKINILQASLLAMQTAVTNLINNQNHIFNNALISIDGNKDLSYLKHGNTNNMLSTSVIKGDSKSITIAAASILAKLHRDNLMVRLHNYYIYNNYGFNTHYGYGTKQHLNAIHKYGITCYHRQSFKPINTMLKK